MKIAILGSYGEGNIGDEAILDAVINNIQGLYSEAKIIVFSHNEDETRSRLNAEVVTVRPMIPSGLRSFLHQYFNGELRRSINELKDTNLVIIGGGGIIYDTEVEVGINPVFIWLIRVFLFRCMRLKVVLYAVGVGPIKKFSSKILLRIFSMLLHNITVRDERSKDLIKEVFKLAPIHVSADPVWTSVWRERTVKNLQDNKILKYDARSKMGIQVRKVKGLSETQFVDKIAKYIDLMVEKYLMSVVLIPFSSHDPNDKLLMEKIKVCSRYENKVEIYKPENLEEASLIIQECEFLLLSRLHSIILATQLGIPFLALSYSAKTDDLLDMIEMSEFSWPISDFEKTILERLYLNLMKKKLTIRKHLLEMAETMKNKAMDNLELLKNTR